MERNKQMLTIAWAIVTILSILVLTVYAGYTEWTQDLTRKQLAILYFVDWAPWSYAILLNALGFYIYIQRK